MNPINFALRRPVTICVMVLGVILAGLLALSRIKIDIFPSLNLPVLYVCQPYGGMDPAQMEGLLANYYEYHFLYIGGIHHVESKNVQGVSLMKLYFHPGTDMAQALAETVGQVNRSRAFMPPGTVSPFIIRFDTGSVPVGYLVLSSETKTIGQIQDQALFKVRPMFANIPGVSSPPPFGGNQRTVVISVLPERLRAYKLSPDAVVDALSHGNAISPSGAIRVQEKMPIVPVNSMVVQPAELGSIPIDMNRKIFIRDVAGSIADANDIATGYALVNGKRAVYILATKRADASTLSVVQAIRENIPKMQAALPEDIRVRFEFDQSPLVVSALEGVAFEALLGAILTGLMVLLFLRDWRSVIVVVLNIPIALIAAVLSLFACGYSLNLMTLGGLALAVGILVDEATVEVENIHSQIPRFGTIAEAVVRGNADTAVPRFLAMLCVLSVFLSAAFLKGPALALFLPMALAVGFAMIASYILSSTLVPVLSIWLIPKGQFHDDEKPNRSYGSLIRLLTSMRWISLPLGLALAIGLLWVAGSQTGTDLFPPVDNGQVQFRLRAPAGTRIEETEAIIQESLHWIKKEIGDENLTLSLGYVGLVPPSYPINCVYQWMGGPEEALMRIAIKPKSISADKLKALIRNGLVSYLENWTDERWKELHHSVSKDRMAKTKIELSFEAADVVNEVMSFGAAAPVEVVVSGPKMADNRAFAQSIRNSMEKIKVLKDIRYGQTLDYPTVDVKIDRERAALSGVHADDVSKSLVAATSSSRFTTPNYWRDPANGIGYQVQVEIPQAIMNSTTEIETIPISQKGPEQRLLRDVAQVKAGTMPGEIDRYNMRRLVSITANVVGTDLGNASKLLDAALAEAGTPPTGVQVDVRGQISILKELFAGLSLGLILSMVAIFLILLAYFQSIRLALIPMLAFPFVLAGIAITLKLTNTTLNLQSFMGSIMAIGVATANAILLVSFAQKAMIEGAHSGYDAATLAATQRFRAILMTGLAMIAGMIPMALGNTSGGEQSAALARAVLGGIAGGLFASLLMLAPAFAILFPNPCSFKVSLAPENKNLNKETNHV
ncbi:MAG: efflux RND transporter permease subunit [Planctomycetes bacterium]|nr:efflux RND transporter permease subunit [Planctomycetota bacterium]